MGFYTHLLNQKAVIKNVDGADSNNNLIISAEKEVNCRIEFKAGITIGSNGEQAASSGRFYTEETVKVGDLIEFDNQEFIIINVSPYYTIDASYVVVEAHFQ